MDALTIRDTCITALQDLPATITDGEPVTGPDGRLEPTVIVSVTAGNAANRRTAGGSVNRAGYVGVMVVTASLDQCLWLAQEVRDHLADLPLGVPHGLLTDTSYDGEPLPDPAAAPDRWSRVLAYTYATKRSHP